jgi:molecular chaperone GrpE
MCRDGEYLKKKRRSIVSEVKRLEKALEEEQKKSGENLNRLIYLKADFENYRKRMEKEIHETTLLGKEKLIIDLLSVVDELELALRSGRETENKQALLQGVEMTLKKVYTTLGREGLTKIDALGKSFDPKLHEVVMKVPTKEHDEGEVIEEVRTGYLFRDKVIRPSMVKIATSIGATS